MPSNITNPNMGAEELDEWISHQEPHDGGVYGHKDAFTTTVQGNSPTNGLFVAAQKWSAKWSAVERHSRCDMGSSPTGRIDTETRALQASPQLPMARRGRRSDLVPKSVRREWPESQAIWL